MVSRLEATHFLSAYSSSYFVKMSAKDWQF